MATPARRPRRASRRPRFDLRATTLTFALVAALLCAAGLVVRTAAGVVEQRPGWAAVLGLCATAGFLAVRRRGRRRAVARAAARAGEALDAGTRTALEELEPDPADAADPAVAPDPAALAPGDGLAPADGLDPAAPSLESMDAGQFEEAVAALCERDGCRDVEVVGGAGDLGADVVATCPQGRRVVLQCKRYDVRHRVGSQDLQRFGGTCFTVHEADVAAVVTTSGFTAPAVEYAEQCGIVCVDGQALRAWAEGTGPAPWEARPCPD
ncbi:restriction endonuclease [Streptomyces mexicanus]|uniref:Restriction endonuclease n=1 Tax=Streptomyces mexicanus TaxID=178566 RepID=A0A7X1I607_9ACTN|nr:restriction endonuclease [Streptomyces mexicanus]MBC2868368.1 restriction endonuclease [Streptomyces mexicanus]